VYQDQVCMVITLCCVFLQISSLFTNLYWIEARLNVNIEKRQHQPTVLASREIAVLAKHHQPITG